MDLPALSPLLYSLILAGYSLQFQVNLKSRGEVKYFFVCGGEEEISARSPAVRELFVAAYLTKPSALADGTVTLPSVSKEVSCRLGDVRDLLVKLYEQDASRSLQ